MKTGRFWFVLVAGMVVGAAASVALAKSEGRWDHRGRLDAFNPQGKTLGECPLRHTDVTVDIAGFVARVTLRQQFDNPYAEKIEAVYTFPLSQDAAVDRMTMTIGDRVIQGEIKPREEAQKIYAQAKKAGKVASLLDQERPNIFTQAVANIEPGKKVDITISYTETLRWQDGSYQFQFPTVVGPRYIPGQATSDRGLGFANPTDQVPDADRVTPQVTPPKTRAGHDLSITVNVNAGLPIHELRSLQHDVAIEYPAADKSRAVVKLKNQATIPNKDFVLEYRTAGETIEDALLTHTDSRGKFFTLVLRPPKRVRSEQIVPREIMFVIDSSGSMNGFPIEMAKEAMRLCIEKLHANDTLNLMSYHVNVATCFDKPVLATPENRNKALQFLADLQGFGGTEMKPAIEAALAGQDDPQRLRIVCFMSDGYVGNDMEILDAIRRQVGSARMFAFGIGTSVNRFLLDGMARLGRGEVEYVLSEEQATGAAQRFHDRLASPLLTNIKLDFGNLPIEELYPQRVPDLFSTKPVVIKGRYKQGAAGTITLQGRAGQQPFQREIPVRLPDSQPQDEALAPLWARAKVEHLMDQDLAGVQLGQPKPAVKEEIVGLGMRYQLLTQFTSFVAVEHKRITEGGQPRTIAVPVEMPEGVSYEGVFGRTMDAARFIGGNLGGFSLKAHGGFVAPGSRRAMVGGFGGTKQSERTVATALYWLARRQNPDGSWSFDGLDGSGKPSFADPGNCRSRCGATALTLLCFAGAGQTHRSNGAYQKNVYTGVYYLLVQTAKAPGKGDLRGEGGDMRWHAAATLALSELYAMTNDKTLGPPTQKAVDFIVANQDQKTGGWALEPGQTPTTSATAWQLLALYSAQQAKLRVDPAVLQRAAAFLDRTQSDGGAFYGETGPGKEPAATAMALLCRLHLGWKLDNPALTRGIDYLAKLGPSQTDMVCNWGTTTLMCYVSGPTWDTWNRGLRKQLVNLQTKDAAEAGSWWTPGAIHAKEGGRLLQTAFSASCLEVYYRYLSLYKWQPAAPK